MGVEKVSIIVRLEVSDDLLQRAKNIVKLLPVGMPEDFASTCVLKVHEILAIYARLDRDFPAESPALSPSEASAGNPTPVESK